MKNKSAYIKYVGNAVTVFAVFLIIKKLISYDLDYRIFLQPKTTVIIFICLVAYIINVLLSTVPWIKMLEVVSGKKMPYTTTMFVNVRSNLFKYIPGNVFQYIGKNELALKCNIGHAQVAISTLLDVIVMFSTSLLLGVLCIREYLLVIVKKYVSAKYVIAIAAILLIIFIAAFLYIKRKKPALPGEAIKIIRNKNNIKSILLCFAYYMVQNMWVGLIYVAVLLMISGKGISEIPFFLIIGANVISWAIGFITPGAPGGLGIREAVMIFITYGMFDESMITLTSVLYRVITVLGDAFAFFICTWIIKATNQRCKDFNG